MIEFRGGVQFKQDEKGEWRWEAYSVERDPNADYEACVTTIEIRSSEGYVEERDCKQGAFVTLQMLLRPVMGEGIPMRRMESDEGMLFTILATNGEELAVQGPVGGFQTRARANEALDRGTLALLLAQFAGEF